MKNKRITKLEDKIKMISIKIESIGLNSRDTIDHLSNKYNDEILLDFVYQRLSIILKEDNYKKGGVTYHELIVLTSDSNSGGAIDNFLEDNYISKFEHSLLSNEKLSHKNIIVINREIISTN